MFRIALCDDNLSFLEYESVVIYDHLTEKDVLCQCDIFISGEELLAKGILIKNYDLFILDYDMDGLTGFEAARKIYEIYPDAKIAFATNYYDFTREGYRYNAVRYLVKQEKTFESELKECVDLLFERSTQVTFLQPSQSAPVTAPQPEPISSAVFSLSNSSLKVKVRCFPSK